MAKVCYRCHMVETQENQAYCRDCRIARREENPKPKTLAYRTYHQVYMQRKRAEKIGIESTLTLDEWRSILEASEGRCGHCRKDVGADRLVIDHVVPVIKGGSNTADNVLPACARCNGRKGSRLDATTPEIRVTRLEDDEVAITCRSQIIRIFVWQLPDLISRLSEYSP